MESSNDTIGNRTRDPPVCGPVLQPTVPPRVPAGCNTETKAYIKLEKGVSIPSCEMCMGKRNISVESWALVSRKANSQAELQANLLAINDR